MNLKIKPKPKIHKPPGEGRLNKDQVIKNFLDRSLEPKTHLELINDIVGKCKLLSRKDYLDVIKKGGEIDNTIDNYTIRNDINGQTFDNSLLIASDLLGIKKEILEKIYLKQETATIGGFEFQLDAEKRSIIPINLTWKEKELFNKETSINVVNYTIKSNKGFYGDFSIHDAGHFTMIDDANSRKSHINYKIMTDDNEIEGHIYYQK